MPMITTSRGPSVLALLFLAAAAAAACAPAARYPGPGEPGPVVTAGGDTIPDGPDREAFMAGFDAGFHGEEVASDSYVLPSLGGGLGGVLVGFALPPLVADWDRSPEFAQVTAAGAGLILISAWLGGTRPLEDVPAWVAARGPLFEAGYREGYVRGHRWQRVRKTFISAGIGLLLGVYVILDANST